MAQKQRKMTKTIGSVGNRCESRGCIKRTSGFHRRVHRARREEEAEGRSSTCGCYSDGIKCPGEVHQRQHQSFVSFQLQRRIINVDEAIQCTYSGQELSALIPARECRRKSGVFIRIFLPVFTVFGPFRQTILVVSCSEWPFGDISRQFSWYFLKKILSTDVQVNHINNISQ